MSYILLEMKLNLNILLLSNTLTSWSAWNHWFLKFTWFSKTYAIFSSDPEVVFLVWYKVSDLMVKLEVIHLFNLSPVIFEFFTFFYQVISYLGSAIKLRSLPANGGRVFL